MSEPHLLLFGPPGAGKGTQSANVADAYGIEHVTTGDALRANKDMETEHGTPREYMEAGELVPDPVVDAIVAEALATAEGYVLDGYPRNLDQAAELDAMTDLDAAAYLSVSESTLVERLTGRRVCTECGRNHHVEFDPPEEAGVCDDCGGELTQREDDTEDVVRERLRVYRENTEPVVERYRERGELIEIDGEQPPEAVWTDLDAAIENVL
ncbi:adenylate kinase [Halobacteriales archaeon QS_4_69_34]|nr:MAG: adenylate kinase [Halobacteriales archaeon QS_4_69_34]